MQLFDRTNHGILLTPAGKVIYKHAKILFEYSEKAIEEARQAMTADLVTFYVGTSILNPCKPFMDLWCKVNHQFPDYRLHIIPFEDDHRDILSGIYALGNKFDFMVAACDSKQWLNRAILNGSAHMTSISPLQESIRWQAWSGTKSKHIPLSGQRILPNSMI